ncbi:MAG: MBL fold metallo-hydrolase [Candidatus Woesearchaeota archaeon]|jgi:glyoxylase-like metal-dependent hydrolase (beta-lactamase superfamily II)|nr:MBL fold metallo-hydrolase [Candidatus Woesearchaeota archaeon]|tara:strand:+ start:216 stop:788 length:573 start_codon:yes stop_codon:yes gene_type:complete
MVLHVEQIEVGGLDKNLSYVVYNKKSKEGIIVDPAGDYDKIEEFIDDNKIKVLFIVNTHGHHDHIEGNDHFKTKYASEVIGHELGKQELDIRVKKGDEIQISEDVVEVMHTPGHAPDLICLRFGKNLICGDLVFAQGTGRTDLEGSDDGVMKRSLGILFHLPEEIIVWPGHNYGGKKTTIKKIKKDLLGY